MSDTNLPTNLPDCAFCGQQFTADEKCKAIFSTTFEHKGGFFPSGQYQASIEWDKDQEFAHEDCWEARNRPFPARRRVIEIGGISNEESKTGR